MILGIKTRSSLYKSKNRLRAIVIIVFALVTSILPSLSSVSAVDAYNNANLADHALTKVGQNGGQCRMFVNNTVSIVSGNTQSISTSNAGGDYFQSFLNAGGIEVSDINQLTKGDIIQTGQYVSSPGLHTFIIVSRDVDGLFWVVDSNSQLNETVRYYKRSSFSLDSTTRAFRMGTVTSGGGQSTTNPIDELGFVRMNHSSGNVELVILHGAPGYNSTHSSTLSGYPAVSDVQNIKVIPIDINGDQIDELGFVRMNHTSGKAELVTYHGSPHYKTMHTQSLPGYPAVGDPESITVLAVDTNADQIDELAFVRVNHGSGKVEALIYHGASHYTTLLVQTLTSYPAVSDFQNVRVIALDVNGDGVDELGFIRFNHTSGSTELVVLHGAPHYTTLHSVTLTSYPAISDPQNVVPLPMEVY